VIFISVTPDNVRTVSGEDSLLYRGLKGTLKTVGRFASSNMRGIGSATIWTGKNIGFPLAQKTLYGIGSATINFAGDFVNSLFSPGRIMTYSDAYRQAGLKGVGVNFLHGFRNPVLGLATTAKNMYDRFPLVERKPEEQVFNKKTRQFETRGGNLKFTKLGMAVLGGAALIANAFQGYDNYMTRRMGQVDANKVTATPDYQPQEYKIQSFDFAGATGDLVFALHANR